MVWKYIVRFFLQFLKEVRAVIKLERLVTMGIAVLTFFGTFVGQASLAGQGVRFVLATLRENAKAGIFSATWTFFLFSCAYAVKAGHALYHEDVRAHEQYTPRVHPIGFDFPHRDSPSWLKASILPAVVCAFSMAVILLSLRYVPTPKEPPVFADRKFIFKDSPVLTAERRQNIENAINAFAAYLIAIPLEIPKDLPSIAITKSEEGSSSGTPEEPTYYDDLKLRVDRIDDTIAITSAYSSWIMEKLLPIDLPKTASSVEEITKLMMSDMAYRGRFSMPFWIYFSDSFAGRQREETKKIAISNALWEVRTHCGQQFADRLMAFTVRAFVDDSRRSYPKTSDEYFLERVRIADRVIDSESSRLPAIEGILRKYGFMPK
jgi:hypothetical protein